MSATIEFYLSRKEKIIMLHRDRRIGKSLYRIVKDGESFRIMEIYNDSKTLAKNYSPRYRDFEEAAEHLKHINRERFFTDPFYM